MTDSEVMLMSYSLSGGTVDTSGVSFQGKSLKLDKEEDCGEVVEAIKACKNLTYLNLEGNTIGVEASKAISIALSTKQELKRALWKDMFTGRMKEEIPNALSYLGNGLTTAKAQLTELDLSDNALGPIGVRGLANFLSSEACYQLQELKLNNNGLGVTGGKILADALLHCYEKSMKANKSLALRLFIAGRNRLENEGSSALALVFQTLGTLEEIVMPQNGIYHQGIKAISNCLKGNLNLKILDLNDNTITKIGANHIAEALPYIPKLKVLNLGDCLLRTEGAIVLAKALADNHVELEELSLDFNEIGSEGGIAIVKAMSNKDKLKKLNINGNRFGSVTKIQIKEELMRSNKLDTFSSLSDDEKSDEDDDEEEDDDDKEESDKENSEENGFVLSEPINPILKGVKSPGVKKLSKDVAQEKLDKLLEDMSIEAKPPGPLKDFLENPSFDNFTNVKEDIVDEFISNSQDFSVDYYIDTYIPLLVKISSMSSSSNPRIIKSSLDMSKTLYKSLFNWAAVKDCLSIVNNSLFVYLGLIKSEDKNLIINWDAKASLSTLKLLVAEGLVPEPTQDILKCFQDNECSFKVNIQ